MRRTGWVFFCRHRTVPPHWNDTPRSDSTSGQKNPFWYLAHATVENNRTIFLFWRRVQRAGKRYILIFWLLRIPRMNSILPVGKGLRNWEIVGLQLSKLAYPRNACYVQIIMGIIWISHISWNYGAEGKGQIWPKAFKKYHLCFSARSRDKKYRVTSTFCRDYYLKLGFNCDGSECILKLQ